MPATVSPLPISPPRLLDAAPLTWNDHPVLDSPAQGLSSPTWWIPGVASSSKALRSLSLTRNDLSIS